VSEQNMRLVTKNTLVKTDFEKVQYSQSYEQNFGQLLANFFTVSFTTLRKNFVDFFNNSNHKSQVFAFNLNPVS